MSVVIKTNMDSIRIQGSLTSATKGMSKSMERMSTGLKINSAKDDAAGAVISSRMEVQLSGNKIAQANVQTGSSLLDTAEGDIDVVENNLSRIRDLVLEAKNGTYSTDELNAMQDEINERAAEINRISTSAKFSELYLFNDTNLQKNGLILQVGSNGGSDNTITADSSIFKSVKFSAITGIAAGTGTGGLQLVHDGAAATSSEMDGWLNNLDNGLKNITDRKSAIGSSENRLESALTTLTTEYENLSSARSIIVDADIAEEASIYTQQSVLQQMSVSLLAQANQNPSIALELI